MNKMIIAAAMAAVALPTVPAMAQTNSQTREYSRDLRQAERQYRRNLQRARTPAERRRVTREYRQRVRSAQRDYRQYRNYDYNRYEPGQSAYYADNYYRSGNYYQERRLGANDRIYRGQNNQYYCRRPDGTTGLIIGGIGGGVLGNIIAPGGSNTLGTIIGAVAGGVAGRAIDRNNVRCD